MTRTNEAAGPLDDKSALESLASLYFHANDSEALFRLATESWPPVGEELPEGIGEVCRYAFVRYVEADQIDQHLWRARALTAAVITGARDTAAGLLRSNFLVAIYAALRGEQSGHESGFEQARGILDEMKRLVPDGAPHSQAYNKIYHAHRAVSYLLEGTGGGRPSSAGRRLLDKAEAEYVLAQEVAFHDARSALKTRGDLALVRYLRLVDEPAEVIAESKKPFLDETVAVRSSADEAPYRDVEGWAATNAGVMDRGEFEGWLPYEVV